MRDRLRLLVGEKPSWAPVLDEYWKKVLAEEEEIPIILEPNLTDGSEIPSYGDDSIYFSIKVHHGGVFSDNFESYDGESIDYFDMCSEVQFQCFDLESMLSELGLVRGRYDVWSCIPECTLSDGILEIDNEEHVQGLLNLLLYTTCLDVYITEWAEGEHYDFSFTQLAVDEREERISEIREECEEIRNGNDEEECEEADKLSFHGDESNIYSSESEDDIVPKSRRRIPPPNPPYRTKKKGRYYMLRGLFKNTEANLVVLDDDGSPPTQPSQTESSKNKTSKRKLCELGEGSGKEEIIDEIKQGRKRVETSAKNVKQCGKCKGTGHNARTCKKERVEVKNVPKNTSKKTPLVTPPSKQSEEPVKSIGSGIRLKQLSKVTPRSIPLKHGKTVMAVTTHGGILKPYKPPAQKVLGVESVPG